jgi:hypothetical protein
MAVLTCIGGRRTWIATDWTDLQTLTGASTQARVGDRCWYRDGACWLVRATITTQEAASKTRWVPELPRHFGANDRSAFPFGSIDDEGIVTVSASDTLTEAELDQQWDCLGLVFDTSGGAIVISPPANTSGPHCLMLRCVHLAVTDANTATISMSATGSLGGEGGTGRSPLGDASNSSAADRLSYHGQFVFASQGGGGGGGTYHAGE